ncbi:MAG: hypothetical protein HUU35_14460, partial [Armatimonadetes bacterium]|nr:hypothetical protein [Armatimonadota bacterium]
MGAWVQRYWEAEFQPVLADWSVRLGLVSLVGTALLMNKRYLCDKQILVSPESRWLALLAWLLASALLLVILGRARSRLVGALLGLLLGLGLMAALMSVHNLEAGWPPPLRSPLRQPA